MQPPQSGPSWIQSGRIAVTDPAIDPGIDPAIDSDTKNWNIGKILSHAPDRHWGSFTRVSMIVYGYLNTFLPILKIFDSCRPPTTPFSAARFVGSLWKISKKFQNPQNHQNRQSREKSVLSSVTYGPATPWYGFSGYFLTFFSVFNQLLKLFAVHMCLWEAIWALCDGFRWCKLPDMAKLLKSPKLRKTAQTGLKWPQSDLNWPQMTSNNI